MLVETIKERIKQAMLTKNSLERDVLRVALGELQTAEARGQSIEDGPAEKILRKLVKSIGETLAAIAGQESKAAERGKLEKEREILESLLPKTLGAEEISASLVEVADAIQAAGTEGQAMGVAMKHLKSAGAIVDGKDVSAVVRSKRS